MRNGVEKVSRAYWYATGGFENSTHFRKATKNGVWQYYIIIERVN